MSFWDALTESLAQDQELAQLDRKECEAVIDAMTLVVFADGQETFLEKQELEQLLYKLPWAFNDVEAIKAYRQKSAACMKEAAQRGEEGFSEAASGIASRLEGVAQRKRAFRMAATLTFADADAHKEERRALMELASAFEIPDSVARLLISEIREKEFGHELT